MRTCISILPTSWLLTVLAASPVLLTSHFAFNFKNTDPFPFYLTQAGSQGQVGPHRGSGRKDVPQQVNARTHHLPLL